MTGLARRPGPREEVLDGGPALDTDDVAAARRDQLPPGVVNEHLVHPVKGSFVDGGAEAREKLLGGVPGHRVAYRHQVASRLSSNVAMCLIKGSKSTYMRPRLTVGP